MLIVLIVGVIIAIRWYCPGDRSVLGSVAHFIPLLASMFIAIVLWAWAIPEIPDGYQEIPSYKVVDGTAYSLNYDLPWFASPYVTVTDGKEFFELSGLRKVLFLPGARFSYKECEVPEGYCVSCRKIYDTAFCFECGQQVRDACPSCREVRNTEFCSVCGDKVTKAASVE